MRSGCWKTRASTSRSAGATGSPASGTSASRSRIAPSSPKSSRASNTRAVLSSNEGQTTCCYAKSEKNWVEDPQGVQWETFLTTGESTVYGGESVEGTRGKPCCQPTQAA